MQFQSSKSSLNYLTNQVERRKIFSCVTASGEWREAFAQGVNDWLSNENDKESNLRKEVEKTNHKLAKGDNWGEVMESAVVGCLLHEERVLVRVDKLSVSVKEELDNLLALLQSKLPVSNEETLDTVEEVCLALSAYVKLIGTVISDIASSVKRTEASRYLDMLRRLIPLLQQSVFIVRQFNNTDLLNLTTKLMKSTVDNVQKTINNKNVTDESESLFVNLIDDALDLLQQHGAKHITVKNLVSEIVCQAMTLSHLANPQDQNTLSSGCQKVMHELTTGSVDLAQCLQDCERCVNALVLKFIVDECSDPLQPMRLLVEAEDSTEMIDQFDLHWERLGQAVSFACSCSGDVKGVYAVKCDLLSLSLLETDIIAFILSMKRENSGHVSKPLAALIQHWSKEMKQLVIDLAQILHPQAFFKVVVEKLESCREELLSECSSGYVRKITNAIFYAIQLYQLVDKTNHNIKLNAALQRCKQTIDSYILNMDTQSKPTLLKTIHEVIQLFKQSTTAENQQSDDQTTQFEFPTDYHDLPQDIDPKVFCPTPQKVGEPRGSILCASRTPRRLVIPINLTAVDIDSVVGQLADSVSTPDRVKDIRFIHKRLRDLRRVALNHSTNSTLI